MIFQELNVPLPHTMIQLSQRSLASISVIKIGLEHSKLLTELRKEWITRNLFPKITSSLAFGAAMSICATFSDFFLVELFKWVYFRIFYYVTVLWAFKTQSSVFIPQVKMLSTILAEHCGTSSRMLKFKNGDNSFASFSTSTKSSWNPC